jgi:hypothetical protein
VPEAPEDPLIAKPTPRDDGALADAIKQLSPEEAEFFLHKLEMAIRRRRLQGIGYIVAITAWLVTTLIALVYNASQDRLVVGAFIIPVGLAGAILYGFGRWADRVGKTPPPGAVGRD